MSPLCLLALLLLPAGPQAACQDPLRSFQEAVLRADRKAAAELLPKVQVGVDAATGAMLEAAVLDPQRRAQAMLTVGRIFRERPVADEALVAGAAALLACSGQGPLLPGMDSDESELERERPEGFDAVAILRGLRELQAWREKNDGDPAALADARWLLASAGLRGVELRPVRIAPGTTLPVPAPLGEDVELRWVPWDLVRDPRAIHRDAPAGPVVTTTLAAGVLGRTVVVPPPGAWLLELSSRKTGLRVVRWCAVSDLVLTAQVLPGWILLMASIRNAPAAGAEIVARFPRANEEPIEIKATVDAQGLCRIAMPAPRTRGDREGVQAVVLARLGAHQARLDVRQRDPEESIVDQVQGHWFVDRPLYRAGETVHGRVLLRNHAAVRAEGSLVTGFRSAPLADAPVTLRFASDGGSWRESITGRTDRDGVLEFRLRLAEPAPSGQVYAEVEQPGAKERCARASLFGVREFRRPAILVTLNGPERIARGKGPLEVDIQAEYATGAPAAGLRVDVEASLRSWSHKVSLTLDEAGRLRVPIAMHELPPDGDARWVHLVASVFSPDGTLIEKRLSVALEDGPPQEALGSARLELSVHPQVPRAGDELEVELTGTPGSVVLLSVTRELPLHLFRVVIEAHGKARVRVPTQPEHWPALLLRATSEGVGADDRDRDRDWDRDRDQDRMEVLLQRPAGDLQIRRLDEKVRFAPGERASLRLQTVDGTGRGVPSTVSVAIVDETLFQVAENETRHPSSALRPDGILARVVACFSAPAVGGFDVLGRMLTAGRVAGASFPEPSGSRSGATTGRGSGPVLLREDLRPTAFFLASLRTDERGCGEFSFAFPHDLTRWRMTAVAVDAGASGGMETWSLETALPFSVTPLLPRCVRTGDEVEIPVLVHRESGGGDTGSVRLEVEGREAEVIGPQVAELELHPPSAARAGFRLAAAATPGKASLRFAGASGGSRDEVRMALPVLPDEAVRSCASSVVIRGEGVLPTRAGASRRVLTLLGGRDALLQSAAQYLQDYPHGCAEQTLAKLVPLFAAAAARRLAGDAAAAVLSEEQAVRVGVGMRALRGLQTSWGSGFGWWSRERTDHGMTGLVLTYLSQAKEAGIDPERYGIRVRPEQGELLELARGMAERGGRVAKRDLPGAESVVASLRYRPDLELQRTAVAALVECDQPLPAGLLARAGIALARAGDAARARTVLERILAKDRLLPGPALLGGSFPGEQRAAALAQLLQLVLEVDPKHAARPGLCAELLRLFADVTHRSTWSSAQVLQAFALDAARSGEKPGLEPIVARVSSGGRTRSATLEPKNGFRADVEIGEGPIRVEVAGGREVCVVLDEKLVAAGSTAQEWRAPLVVERRLFRREVDPNGDERRVPITGSVLRGELIDLELTVAATEDLAWLALECPLPAGFEVPGTPSGVDVRDDRVVVAIDDLGPERRVTRTVRVVAARAGNLAWPPAVAECMYAPGVSGGSAGGRIIVVEPPPGGARPAVSLLLSRTRRQEELQRAVRDLDEARTGDAAAKVLARMGYIASGAEAARALLPRADALLAQFPGDEAVARGLTDLLAEQPEAVGLAAACASGRATNLGLVLLLARPRGAHGDAGLPAVLVRVLTDPMLCGLDLPARRALVLGSWSTLAGHWEEDVGDASLRGRTLHAESLEVAPQVRAWEPFFEALAQWWSATPPPPEEVAKIVYLVCDPVGASRGGEPSASLIWARALMERTARKIITGWLASGLHGLPPLDPDLAERVVALAQECNDAELAARVLEALVAPALHRRDTGSCFYVLLAKAGPELCARIVPALLPALADARSDVRRAAFEALPEDARRAVPARVISAVYSEWIPELGVRALLAAGAAGKEILFQSLGRVCRCQDEVIRELGPEVVGRAPLETLRSLAGPAGLAEVLAKSVHSDDALAGELDRMGDRSWCLAVVQALARRGVRSLPRAEDPDRKGYATLLAGLQGERFSAEELLRWLYPEAKERRSPDDQVGREVVRLWRRWMTPGEFLGYGARLTVREQGEVLARFSAAELRAVLAGMSSDSEIGPAGIPAARAAELREELLALAARVPELRRAAYAKIGETAGGVEFLQRHVLEQADERESRRIAHDLLAATGRSWRFRSPSGAQLFVPESLEAKERAVLLRIEREGLGAELASEERAAATRLLRRRGCLGKR